MSTYSYTKAITITINITDKSELPSKALTNINDHFPIFKSPYPRLRNDRSLHNE